MDILLYSAKLIKITSAKKEKEEDFLLLFLTL